jgi:hypothetical protein
VASGRVSRVMVDWQGRITDAMEPPYVLLFLVVMRGVGLGT